MAAKSEPEGQAAGKFQWAQHGRMSSRRFAVLGSTNTGVVVNFQNVGIEVRAAKGKGTKHLLRSVTGALGPCQMTALMGPSGSGKTTLLDVLSGRKTSGVITGQVLYGNQAPTRGYLRSAVGYVEQHPTLLAEFTVQEMLMYTAELKRPWSEPRSRKQEVVQQLMQDLNLATCAHVLIGDPLTKGISGGQAKRVSIGVAMVCVPPVLYLDEPTSGLDSQSALEIMSLVKKTTLDGTTVAVAIHSPGPEVFAMFDTAIVLAKGRLVYMGPTGPGHAPKVYDAAAQWLPDTTSDTPLPELLLKAAATADQSSDDTAVDALADALRSAGMIDSGPNHDQDWPLHSADGTVTVHVNALGEGAVSQSSVEPTGGSFAAMVRSRTVPTRQFNNQSLFWPLVVFILIKYRAIKNWTRLSWHLPRMLDKVVFAFIIASVFYGQGSKTGPGAVIPQTASLFMWVAISSNSAYGFITGLFPERPLYYREQEDGLYTPFPHLLFKTVEELAPVFVLSLLISPLPFFVVAYQGSFLLYWLTYLLLISTSAMFGYAVAAYCPSQDYANAAIALVVTAMFFTAGLFITVSALPVYWQWFAWVNFARYGNMALLLNQYEGNDFIATIDGQTVTQWMDVSGDKWLYNGIIAAMGAGFFAIAWLGLTLINHRTR